MFAAGKADLLMHFGHAERRPALGSPAGVAVIQFVWWRMLVPHVDVEHEINKTNAKIALLAI